MRVIAAMSGGVDSSVAAALLVEQGHEVTGVFLRNGFAAGPAAASGRQGCCSVGDASDAGRVADLLGIPFYCLDFADEFGALVDDFARSYAEGRTPNPCVACNRDLKFGRLLRFADGLGADAVATGHYAAVEPRGGRCGLRVPADRRKDQTYVLFPLGQDALRRAAFPLAGMTKEETRAYASGRGLPVAEKPESMELCFVPGGDYREVVAARAPSALAAGDVVDERSGAVIGRHGGVGTVTVGQRRGLGIATGSAVYVTRIDAARNVVFAGTADDLRRRTVRVAAWNAVSVPEPAAGTVLRGRAKVRRNHEPQPAVLTADGGAGCVRVDFDEPVRAPAPGQALVLYDDDGFVLGGGWIVASEP
jgi:tRNA-specific 2-thiouridylase